MRTGRAPRRRGVDNWSRVVDSFTGSVDTLYNNMVKELKNFINTEIAGPNGPTKQFRGACRCHPPPPWPGSGPSPFVPVPSRSLMILCAALIGTPPNPGDKCILHHFGKRQSDKSSTFRVSLYTYIPIYLHTYMIPISLHTY